MIDATDTIETSRMLALPDELMLEVVKHVRIIRRRFSRKADSFHSWTNVAIF